MCGNRDGVANFRKCAGWFARMLIALPKMKTVKAISKSGSLPTLWLAFFGSVGHAWILPRCSQADWRTASGGSLCSLESRDARTAVLHGLWLLAGRPESLLMLQCSGHGRRGATWVSHAGLLACLWATRGGMQEAERDRDTRIAVLHGLWLLIDWLESLLML